MTKKQKLSQLVLSLEEIVKTLKISLLPKEKNNPTKSRRLSALKAWKTMKKKYSKKEISERARKAAFKAWKTIRKNKVKK